MPKNIILCADGTGNKGGVTPDSNVYKIYKSIDKYFKGKIVNNIELDKQIVFYDNGVGTHKNKYIRAFFAAFGFGFEDNVCDLYKFLARHYEPGDRIYFFGFSRGSSTVRACNGFISICGLAKGAGLRNCALDQRVSEAFSAYKKHRKQPELAASLKNSENSHGAVDIEFLGIWDTVVALGFPKRTDITGPVSALINMVLWVAETTLDRIWNHSFYYYRLTDNVKQAYQALAIDDERTAFWPFVWREQGRTPGSVEQVWFAGMHSNVGGGYARSGMASISLYWMMVRAQKHGLVLLDDAIREAYGDSHVHGRMYNSRDGFGSFYRYHPRDIEELCKDRVTADIKIHRSVIERMYHRTANYAPGHLPAKFHVVDTDPANPGKLMNPGEHTQWAAVRGEIKRWVFRRKGLYAAMLTFVLTVIITATWLRFCPPDEAILRTGLAGALADLLDFISPDFFDNIIDVAVVRDAYYVTFGAAFCASYVYVRAWCREKTVDACEMLRHIIIQSESNEDNK